MVKDIEFFDATPDRRLLVDIGAANYTVPQAIAELVANCMDAKVPIDEFQVAPIQIDISVTDESVSIIDNGQGMERRVLGEAMRL
jgi:DNA gyrase/topoisomerase IV subunit B